jgi:hypothetical protein
MPVFGARDKPEDGRGNEPIRGRYFTNSFVKMWS